MTWDYWFGTLMVLVTCVVIGALPGCIREGENRSGDGVWFQVRPPPGAPDGTECWVWREGGGSTTYGGPVCFES